MLHYLKTIMTGDRHKKKGPSLLIAGKIDKGDETEDHEKVENDKEIPIIETQELDTTEDTRDSSAPLPETNYHFIDYIVTDDDTLYGIALSYMMNPAVLKRDNGLEIDEIFPGQILKVRVRDDQPEVSSPAREPDERRSADAEDIPKTNAHFDNLKLKPRSNTVNLKLGRPEPAPIDKWIVYYCTSIGDIEGIVTVDESKLVFLPVGLTKSTLKSRSESETEIESPKRNGENGAKESKPVFKEDYQDKYLIHFGAEIELNDIAESNIMIVPSTACEDHFNVNHEYEKDYLLQIILSNHGQRSMGKYLNDLLSRMRGNKTSYACIYFKLKNQKNAKELYSNKEKDRMLHQLKERIAINKQNTQETTAEASEGTHLPYFEFLFDRFEKDDAALLRKLTNKENAPLPQLTDEERRKILEGIYDEETKKEEVIEKFAKKTRKRLMIPKIVGESHILNLEQWTELINCVPPLYQTLQWRLIHSTSVNGSSYQNMIRKTQHASPSIIVIKDEDDFVFGAYCSDEINYSQDYYGNGETFLFTFRDLNEISTFEWTKKNNFFLLPTEEGITFGAGGHYGLWINNELRKGRSSESETFDNKMLSFQPDFDIMKLEVWSIIDPFATPEEETINFSDMSEYNR